MITPRPLEGVEQVGDRPLAHPRRAVEVVGSVCRGQQGRQESQARSRIRDIQARLAEPGCGRRSPQARIRARGGLVDDIDPQRFAVPEP